MFKVYALRNCDFCKKAVDELRIGGWPFLYCPLDGPPTDSVSTDTIEAIKKKYNWPTVPIIIRVADDEEHLVGGYSDLIEFLDEKSTM